MTNSRMRSFLISLMVPAAVFIAGSASAAKPHGIRPHAEAVFDGSQATVSEPIGPDAIALIDDMDDLLTPEKAHGTFERLSRLGSMAVPSIRQMMKRQNLRLVRAGLDLSERIGAEARDARHDLADVVSDKKFGALRVRAARILGGLGDKASDALPQLMKTLDDPSAKVRDAVARALLDIASRGTRLSPALKELLGTRGRWREQAINLLVMYGPLLHPALPVLAKLVAQKPTNAGEATISLIPQLIPALGNVSKAAGILMSMAGRNDGEIGANDEALEEATMRADEAASFEDIGASAK